MNTYRSCIQYCIASIFGLLLFLGMSACNEQSPIAGGDLYSDTINVDILTSDSIPMFGGISILNSKPAASYPLDLFLGSAKGYESSILARFGNVPDSLGDAQIISAQLILQPKRYALGDSLSNRIAFDVFSILKPWTPRATIDTFLQAGFLETMPQGTFDGSIALRDTMPTISVSISQSLIQSWFALKQKAKTDSTINTESAYAIALKPKVGSAVIRAFARYRYDSVQKTNVNAVLIRVLYKKSGSTTIDTMTLESAYEGSFTTEPPAPSGKMILNCGTGSYSGLECSLKQLPTGIAIHGAVLKLTLDTALSIRGNVTRDSSISAQFVDSTAGNLIREFSGEVKSDITVYEFPVMNALVESLLRNTRTGTLKIFPSIQKDRIRLDRLVFHGPNDPDPKKRPSLRIVYSTRPKP